MLNIEDSRMARKHEQINNDEPVQNLKAAKPKHHFGLRLIMVITGLVFFISLLFSRTVLNSTYMSHQVVSSSIGSNIEQSVNSQLQKYGVNNQDIVPEGAINQVVQKMAEQLYAGQTVQVDQQIVSSAVNNGLRNSNSNATALGMGLSNTIASQAVNVINNQLNTNQLNTYASDIQTLVNVNRITMIISGVLLVIWFVLAVFSRIFVSAISSTLFWTGLLGGIGFGAVYLSNIVGQLSNQYQVASDLIKQVGNDVLTTGFLAAIIMVVVGIILWIIVKITHFRSKKIG